jgi:hypothetical protein
LILLSFLQLFYLVNEVRLQKWRVLSTVTTLSVSGTGCNTTQTLCWRVDSISQLYVSKIENHNNPPISRPGLLYTYFLFLFTNFRHWLKADAHIYAWAVLQEANLQFSISQYLDPVVALHACIVWQRDTHA